jgi:hypothetical protein
VQHKEKKLKNYAGRGTTFYGNRGNGQCSINKERKTTQAVDPTLHINDEGNGAA